MKLLPLAVVVAALSSTTITTPVQAAGGDQLIATICNYVDANDKSRLRKQLKEGRLKLKNIYSKVSCNGNSLLRAAMMSDSNKVGEFIVKKLPKSTLTSPEADGQTIYDWAQSNGKGGSPIAAAIKARAGL